MKKVKVKKKLKIKAKKKIKEKIKKKVKINMILLNQKKKLLIQYLFQSNRNMKILLIFF